MKEFRNPVFDLGVVSIILFMAGIFILNTSEYYGYIVLFTAVSLGIIFTVINIFQVVRSKTLTGQRKILWIVIVTLVPMLGGFIYYIFSGSNERKTIE